MDFNLTEEQIELKEAARNFAQNESVSYTHLTLPPMRIV